MDPVRSEAVSIGVHALPGDLDLPSESHGIVLFAHGSGSSRLSPRNRMVAARLHEHGLATLLFDLLTTDEEAVDARTAELRFDIGLLARRLVEAIDWTATHPALSDLPLGCFGASTGAAAALVASVERPGRVRAVVSRGGRPDLADASLAAVRSPTLLIVGGADRIVVDLNEAALAKIVAPARLEIVPGATHLFEEPGALERVAELAGTWFDTYLR